MRKLSKGVFLGFITNSIVLVLVALVFVVAFIPNNKMATVGDLNFNPYYNGDTSKNNVSLMFNVYENTAVVNKILDILKENDVKATFFVGGCWADHNEKCLIRIVSEGHELGNHGYFHKDHQKLTYEQNKEEIYMTEIMVKALCGVKTRLFAPPSGAFNKETLKCASELDYKVIMWSKDTIDWKYSSEEYVYKKATKNLKNGDLVLMHPKEHTANTLQKILKYYKDSGFSEVTVSENIGEVN